MKLGTSLRFVFPTSPHTLALYQQMAAALPPGAFIERPMGALTVAEQAANLDAVAAAAREAGMWALLVGDNHAVPPGYAHCFQPVPTIARLSAFTGPLSVGAVVLAPFQHPVLLAEQIATVAAFAPSPTIWAFAVGDRQGAFDAFGLDRPRRGAHTDAVLRAVRRLLAGESVTEAGPPGAAWLAHEATISPKLRHPATLLVAGSAPGALERAARLGDGWLSAQNATDGQLAGHLRAYLDACDTHDRSPMPVLRRDIHVAASDAEAREHIEPIVAEGYRGVTMRELIVGSPATVVERLRGYEAMGFEHVLVRHITGDHDLMLESFRLLGAEVLPHLQG